jgi:hypothetical protein
MSAMMVRAPLRPVATVLLLLAASSLAAAGRLSPGAAAAAGSWSAGQPQVHVGRQLLRAQSSLLGLDKANKQLRVLAHGDSITEGWINTAWIKTPWTPKLQQQLQAKMGSDWHVEVVNGGE